MKRLGVRGFLLMAGAGAIGVILWFVVMQLAFGAAQGPPAALVFEIVGFVSFGLWLASAVVTLSVWSAHLCGRCHKAPIRLDPQLPSGRWQAAYSAPNSRRVLAPHTFAKRAVAEAWLVDRRREIDRGLWSPGATGVARTRFDAYSSRWLANRDLKPRTAEQYQQILTTHLLPAFGEMQLAAIALADVRDWYSDLLPGKPTMRARTYALLRAILATAITDELIDSSPCRIRGAGQTQRVHKIRPASVAEVAELTAAMPDRLKLAVPLASWCTLRFGEMIELRRGDIDLSDEVIRVRTATPRAR